MVEISDYDVNGEPQVIINMRELLTRLRKTIKRTRKNKALFFEKLEEEIKAKKQKREPVMLPRFSCHIFRHTFASRFCENETNVKVIQEVMGHADVSTTMNIYAEVNESITRQSLENLAKNMDVF